MTASTSADANSRVKCNGMEQDWYSTDASDTHVNDEMLQLYAKFFVACILLKDLHLRCSHLKFTLLIYILTGKTYLCC